jgi:hypothetical protein
MRSEIVLIVAILGLLPVASRAQESGGAVACPSIQNDQERLACYDRAMRGAPRAPAPAPAQAAPVPAPAQAAPVPPPASTPAPASAAAPAVVGAAAVGAAAATETIGPASVAPAAVAPTTVAPATTSSSTISTSPHHPRNTTAATPPQPGAPPTFDPNTGAPIGVVPVVVLSALSRPGYGTEFTTDRGGVWIQTEAKALPTLPKTPFNAELQAGTLGSTFLVVTGQKLGIRVRQPNK